MPTERIVIAAHDPSWSSQFDCAAAELRSALDTWVVEIAHIGSTAVPGLAAKPIIDIQIGVTELALFTSYEGAISALGYQYVPEYEAEWPNRRYFRRRNDAGAATHHLHLVDRADRQWWDRHIAFRDWLRAHPDDRARYQALKVGLAEAHPHDRDRYTEGKTEFIDAIVERAADTSPPPPR